MGFTDDRGERRKNKEKKSYQNEETQPPCNLSSSIYYGGQDNYSSSTPPQATTNPNYVSPYFFTQMFVLHIDKTLELGPSFPSYARVY